MLLGHSRQGARLSWPCPPPAPHRSETRRTESRGSALCSSWRAPGDGICGQRARGIPCPRTAPNSDGRGAAVLSDTTLRRRWSPVLGVLLPLHSTRKKENRKKKRLPGLAGQGARLSWPCPPARPHRSETRRTESSGSALCSSWVAPYGICGPRARGFGRPRAPFPRPTTTAGGAAGLSSTTLRRRWSPVLDDRLWAIELPLLRSGQSADI